MNINLIGSPSALCYEVDPHIDAGISPFEHIQIHSPRDLLHNGWLDRDWSLGGEQQMWPG